MKSVLILFLGTFSINAWALDAGNSWTQIFAAGASTYQDYSLGGIALQNACLTPTEIRSIQPQRICEKLREVLVNDGEGLQHTEYVCDAWGMAQFRSPRTYSKTVCDKFVPRMYPECAKWVTFEVTVPETIPVGVYEIVGGERMDTFPGFSKLFTFPACN